MRNGLAAAVLITHYALRIPNCSSCAVANIPRMVGAVWYCDGIHTTASTGFTPELTELKKRGPDIWTPGESLGIETTDTYTVTHVVGGKTCTATAPVNDITLTKVIWGLYS